MCIRDRFLADADRLEHKPCVLNILCGRAEHFVYYAHMARCNRGFTAEAEAFCIFRIAHYALIVVNVGERSVINIDPGRTGGADEPRAGIVYLLSLIHILVLMGIGYDLVSSVRDIISSPEELAMLFKALSEPSRLDIINLLRESPAYGQELSEKTRCV